MTDITTVVFDWGGVLIDQPSRELVEYAANHFGVDPDHLQTTLHGPIQDFQKGNISEHLMWTRALRPLGLETKLPDNMDYENSVWYKAAEAVFNYRLDVQNLALSLKENGYVTGFLSNTEKPAFEAQGEWVKKNLYPRIVSYKLGVAKPQKEIYIDFQKAAFKKPEEIVFIDDYVENIDMAKKIGWQGIVYQTFDQVKQELRDLGVKFK